MERFSLARHKIRGPIPKWMWNISKETLEVLFLHGNFDQHPVVFPWSRLYALRLDFNMLQGQLPIPPLSIMSYSVSVNNLTGEIPPLICNTTSLMVLDLSSNNLSGMVPPCMGMRNFSKSLLVLNLRRKSFDGPIPETCTVPNNLRVIDKFQDQLPSSLTGCTMLEYLVLGNNQIDDIFPFWLGALPHLKVLILESNRFHGALWSWHINFTYLSLCIIDLPDNEFIGDLSSRYFQNWDAMKLREANNLSYMQASPIFVLMGYGSGLVVGISIGYCLTSWKHEWFVKTFGKPRQRKWTRTERMGLRS